MDQETAQYIRFYFSKLMTENERLALNHAIYSQKSSESPQMRKKMIERGWITDRPEILELLKDGYEAFEIRAAKRIVAERSDELFLNNCPNCGKLARTPQAKQCRHCGHTWRD